MNLQGTFNQTLGIMGGAIGVQSIVKNQQQAKMTKEPTSKPSPASTGTNVVVQQAVSQQQANANMEVRQNVIRDHRAQLKIRRQILRRVK